MMAISHCFKEVNGIELHYATQGQGEPMIFLHGFPACWYVWKKQLEQFSVRYWVIVPDGRGVNQTSKPSDIDSYKIDQLVEDVIGLANHLGIKKFILIGHDWGGTLAWQIAQSYPERVSRLIVVNAPPYHMFLRSLAESAEQRLASKYMERLKSEAAEKILLANECEMLWNISFAPFYQSGILNEVDRAYYLRCWQTEGSLSGFLNWYRANIPQFDQIEAADHLPEKGRLISTPSLLIWGEYEKAFTRRLLEYLPEYVSNLQLIQVPQSDHWVMLEQPEKFYQIVSEFLDCSDTSIESTLTYQ